MTTRKKIIISIISLFFLFSMIFLTYKTYKYYIYKVRLIPEKKMNKILSDIIILESAIKKIEPINKRDTLYKGELSSILNKYQCTFQQLQFSVDYYLKQPDIMEKLLKEVISSLAHRKGILDKKISQ